MRVSTIRGSLNKTPNHILSPSTNFDMGDHDSKPACLSAENHSASDHVTHYLGCLEFHEREAHLSRMVKPQKRKQIESELRRIGYLRHTLRKDPVESQLVTNLERSMGQWRCGDLYTGDDGINAVRAWRTRKDLPNGVAQRQVVLAELKRLEDYDPDCDFNAYLTRFEDSKPVVDLKDDRFNGHFPNHKISAHRLLDYEEELNPLTRTENPISATRANPERVINYFHLPANNMIVSAIPSAYSNFHLDGVKDV